MQIPAAGSAWLLPCQVGAIISDHKQPFPGQEQRPAPGKRGIKNTTLGCVCPGSGRKELPSVAGVGRR